MVRRTESGPYRKEMERQNKASDKAFEVVRRMNADLKQKRIERIIERMEKNDELPA